MAHLHRRIWFLYLSIWCLWSFVSGAGGKQKVAWHPLSSRTHKKTHTHDASLSAAIQMSCVACAATSRRGRGCPPRHSTPPAAPHLKPPLWQPGLTPAAPPLQPPSSSPHHQGDLAPPPPPSPASTQGSLCQCLAPGQPASRPAPQAAHKPGDSSRLVGLLRYLTASQLASDVKKKKPSKI